MFVLLDIAEMSSSSYYDACQSGYEVDDQKVISEIKVIRNKFKDYGYRRVTIELKRRGYNINHKKVLRIMKNEGLLCDSYKRKIRKYNSYKGTCGKVASNRLRRRFTTDRPYQKIVTDVTELRWGNKTTSERAYFTAFMDLYNGEIISWNIGLHPNVDFIVFPLNKLMGLRPKTSYRMTIHSDQGFQYQNGRYINILKSNNVFSKYE